MLTTSSRTPSIDEYFREHTSDGDFQWEHGRPSMTAAPAKRIAKVYVHIHVQNGSKADPARLALICSTWMDPGFNKLFCIQTSFNTLGSLHR